MIPKLVTPTNLRWRRVSFADEPDIGFELSNNAITLCEITRVQGKFRVVFGPSDVAYAISSEELEAFLPEGRRLLAQALAEFEASLDGDRK